MPPSWFAFGACREGVEDLEPPEVPLEPECVLPAELPPELPRGTAWPPLLPPAGLTIVDELRDAGWWAVAARRE